MERSLVHPWVIPSIRKIASPRISSGTKGVELAKSESPVLSDFRHSHLRHEVTPDVRENFIDRRRQHLLAREDEIRVARGRAHIARCHRLNGFPKLEHNGVDRP